MSLRCSLASPPPRYFLPSSDNFGSGGFWVNPGGDLAENLTGHLAFQSTGWQWPPLLAPNWPGRMAPALQ